MISDGGEKGRCRSYLKGQLNYLNVGQEKKRTTQKIHRLIIYATKRMEPLSSKMGQEMGEAVLRSQVREPMNTRYLLRRCY